MGFFMILKILLKTLSSTQFVKLLNQAMKKSIRDCFFLSVCFFTKIRRKIVVFA